MSRMPIICGLLLAAAAHAPASQAQPADSFYNNKQISLIVGYNPGGTYDLYSRFAAAWLPRYIPGNPKIIVRNMPGAGGAKAANFLYQQGSKDGLTIGMISQAAALQQVIQDPAVEYDVRKFEWIGRITPIVEVTAVWHTSPVKTIQEAMKRETVLAATAAGATSQIMPNVMNQIVGTKFKITKGYPGTTGGMLAMERGEVDIATTSWAGIKATKQDWLKEKKIKIILQDLPERDPELPDVPCLVELGTTPEQKQILGLYASGGAIGRAVMAPPGLPADVTKTYRDAFITMAKDPEFLADMQKTTLDVEPLTGEELQKVVVSSLEVPQAVRERAKAAFAQ